MARKEERRVEILEAATKVFASKGFHAAKVEEIADAARVGKGTIYEYFASKSELFDHMVDYMLTKYNQGLEAVLMSQDHIADSLLEAALYLGGIMQEAIGWAQAIMATPQSISRETMILMMNRNAISLEILQHALERAKSRGQLRPDLDCYVASHVIAGAFNHYLGRTLFMKGELSIADATKVVEVLLNGILR